MRAVRVLSRLLNPPTREAQLCLANHRALPSLIILVIQDKALMSFTIKD